jgi:hypothetical protein
MINASSKILYNTLLLLIFISFALTARAGSLRAGAARVDVSPTPDEFPFTAEGTRPIAPYVGNHDPVYARAMFLDDGTTQVAFVVVDVVAIPTPEKFLPAVAKAVGLPEANVFIAASHTHSTPLVNYHVDLPYQVGKTSPQQAHEIDRLRDAAAEAVREAKASLQPALVSFGRGKAWLNINSDDPQGPSDKSLDVLRVETADGAPIALLVDFGVPSGLVSDNYRTDGGVLVSGDLFGTAARLLETQGTKGPVVLFASSDDGDQRSIISASLPKVGTVPAKDAGDAQWVILEAMGRSLANSTLGVMAAMPKGTADVKISALAKTVVCPGVHYTPDETTHAMKAEDRAPVPIPLNLITINDIALAGVAGNVYAEMGEKIKDNSPFAQTTLIGGTNGSVGYILPESAFANGRNVHSLMGDPIKAGCAEKSILDGLGELMRSAKH